MTNKNDKYIHLKKNRVNCVQSEIVQVKYLPNQNVCFRVFRLNRICLVGYVNKIYVSIRKRSRRQKVCPTLKKKS